MIRPELTVIIPTFNRAYTLRRAIDSVLAQTVTSLEIMVVDDGSTDGTAQLIARYYPDVIYIYQCNQGVSVARNCGIERAQGRYIAFLDSDDAWVSNKLALQLAALSEHADYKVCHSNEIWYRLGVRVNEKVKHRKSGGWIFQSCLPLCVISPSSVVIEKKLLNQLGRFDPELPACEDYDLWLRLCAVQPVLYLSQALTLKYGGHEDQLSTKYWGMDRFRIKSLCKIIDSRQLGENDLAAACAVLQHKIDIYIIGAAKRNKLTEVNYYEKLKQQYGLTTSDCGSGT